jgi:hypothetical protein
MSDSEYNSIPNKDPFVNKMLMNEVIPVEIQKLTKHTDDAFANLLNVARTVKEHDFKDGLYYS